MRHFLLLVFLFLLSRPSWASNTHCDDVAAWHDWDERIATHPDDTALHTLHALWMGLCAKVTRKELTSEQADDVFEYVRRSFIEQRRAYDAETAAKPPM